MNIETQSVSVPKQSKPKIHKCDKCNLAFSRRSRLRIHKFRHDDKKPFPCNYPNCNKAYTNQSHLKRHKNITHLNKVTNQEVMCNVAGCGLSLANKYSLAKHMRRYHDKENPRFPCTVCDKQFNCKATLDAHLLIHGKDPQFTCDICNKKFVQSHLYQKHVRNHKTYTCKCEATFPRMLLLKEHKRNHCKLRRQKQVKINHTCNICKRHFTSAQNLNSHAMVHSANSPLDMCPYPDCYRAYKYLKNLRHHIKTIHHKIFPIISCSKENCNSTFKSKASLKNHLLRVHSNMQKIIKPKKSTKVTKNNNLALQLSGIEEYFDQEQIESFKPQEDQNINKGN